MRELGVGAFQLGASRRGRVGGTLGQEQVETKQAEEGPRRAPSTDPNASIALDSMTSPARMEPAMMASTSGPTTGAMSALRGPWSTADAAFESASRSAAASPADRAVGASVDAHAVRFASAAASSGLLSTGAADACAARACAVREPNADHSCAIRFECDPSVLSRSARAASLN